MTNGLVHLQGIGKVRAKPASAFEVGERMGWNYGYTSQVISKEKRGQFIHFKMLASDNQVYSRRMKPSRLVALGD